jgi:hypothetical protein
VKNGPKTPQKLPCCKGPPKKLCISEKQVTKKKIMHEHRLTYIGVNYRKLIVTNCLYLTETWDLPNEEEKYDVLPEIWEGHNVADFIDPEIMEVLKFVHLFIKICFEDFNLIQCHIRYIDKKKSLLSYTHEHEKGTPKRLVN